MIRLATEADLPELYRMACLFKANSPYADIPEDEAKIKSFILALLKDKKDKSIVLIADHGMIAGTTAEFMWNTQKHSAELVWWVDLGHRGKLGKDLKSAYEYWSKNVAGCTHSHMAALDDRVGRLYEKDNYRRTETSYLKELI